MAVITNVSPSVLWYEDTNGQLKYLAFAATMEENHTGTATVSKYPVQKGFEVSNHLIRHNRQIQVRAYIPENILGGIELEGAEAGFKLGNMANKYLGVDATGVSTIIGGVLTDPFGVAANYIEGAVSSVTTTIRGITDAGAVLAGNVDEFFGTNLSEGVKTITGAVNEYAPSNSRRINAFRIIQDIQENGTLCALGTALHNYSDLVLVDYKIPTSIEAMSVMFVDLTFEQILVLDSEGQKDTYITVGDTTATEEADAQRTVSKFTGTVKSGLDSIGSLFD